MKKVFLLMIILSMYSSLASMKVLHMSLHRGCIEDFKSIASNIEFIELTSWYIHEDPKKFDIEAAGSAIYNIGHERAKRIWSNHKDYFNSFDVVITSDTAPLSRIFLQNNWNKPLIIWVCNRFDYYDGASLDCNFPDEEYYQLFKEATKKPLVKIISYTRYEQYYAKRKGIDWGENLIKPLGTKEQDNWDTQSSWIPKEIDQKNTLFVNPRLESWGLHPGQQYNYLKEECNKRGINTYMGTYNGPDDLKEFKGVLFFPYAWSNLALFENIQRGIIHFVPSIDFINILISQNKPVTYFTNSLFEVCEWYCPENKDLFVYFDSWDDLKCKMETINYSSMRSKIKELGSQHRDRTLKQWINIFNFFRQYNF